MKPAQRYHVMRLLAGLLFLVLLAACSDNGSSAFVAVSGGSSGSASGGDSGSGEPPPPLPPSPPPEVFAITSPVRLAAYDADSLLVSDYDSNRILFVDKATLEPTGGFSLAGKPSGALFADGRIFVGNVSSHSVEIFDSGGNILSRLGERGAFAQVNDIGANPDLGLIYVLDSQARLIRTFRYDGSDAGTIGTGVLSKPTAIAVDPSGNILVSDYGGKPGSFSGATTYIRIFDSLGSYRGSITVGSSVDNMPQGLFADAGGYVYVANARSGQVKIFNLASKTLHATLGGMGVEEGQYFLPLDVFVDEVSRDLFVADFSNKRISVMRGGGVLP